MLIQENLHGNEYNVPSLAGYFVDNDEHAIYLVTSDLTEGGMYRLWGMSYNMTIAQHRELKDMKISESEFEHIVGLMETIVQKLNGDKFCAKSYHYHLRQNKKTKEFEICLLDVDASILELVKLFPLNNDNSRDFLECLAVSIDS